MSVSTHNFSMIPRADIPRSVFDRSHNRKMTFDADKLVPIFVDEVLPGDSFKLDFDLFCRMTSPLTTPVMDNLYLDTFWFFVPNRLVWENWQRFCGEQDNPGDSTDYVVPTIEFDASTAPIALGSGNVGELAEAFGLPLFGGTQQPGAPTQSGKLKINALPFRAYNLIYNEWFRDQNLIDSVKVNKGDADYPALEGSAITDYSLLKRAKRHDYFTSALPWPQKGPGVELPIGGVAPVSIYTPVDVTTPLGATKVFDAAVANNQSGQIGYMHGFNWGDTDITRVEIQSGNDIQAGETTFLQADLGSASAVTINTMRQAFQLQRLYERDARGGSRYTEILRSHFGVISPDARLQRPEYLGGTSQPFVINPISQTSATTDVTPQGNLVAIGMTGSSERGFRKSFVEHGYIIGLANVRADVNYQQGVNRIWSRKTRFDFYWPALAHLGEQAILNKEIYVQGSDYDGDSGDDAVFGYQERWAEYRYSPNEIVGKMRSNASGTLDIWHLAQYFTSLPGLNKDFIESNTPMARVQAVTDEPDFLLDVNFRVKAARPMPVYSVPGLIDHF